MIRILLLGLTLALSLSATEPYRAVFDCSSGDMNFVKSRFWLIQSVAEELDDKEIKHDFVLTIHSKCTPVVAKDLSGFKDKKRKAIKKIQDRLSLLAEIYNVKIEACDIALMAHNLLKEDILDFVSITPNSITRVIELQNKGYALIPYN